MDNALDLVLSLQKKGVNLLLERGKLTYRAPKGVLTDADLANLKDRKDDVVDVLEGFELKRRALTRAPHNGEILPSREQEYWIEDITRGRIAGADWVHMTSGIRLRGALDVEALNRALTFAITRHEILRMRYRMEAERVIVLIDPPSPVELELTDLTCVREDEREARARSLASEYRVQPLDLFGGTLFRFNLIRLSDTDHVLLIVLHHSISDHISLTLLHAELQHFYAAYALGHSPIVAELPFQYADYVSWQRSWLTSKRQREYTLRMKQQLSHAMRFPVDATASSDQPAVKVYCPLSLSAEFMTAIRQLALRERTTRYLVILTALKIALACWTGERQVTLASVSSLRVRKEIENMVGPFTVMDPVCSDLSGEPTFAEALQRVANAVWRAQDFRPLVSLGEYGTLVNVFVDYVPDLSAHRPPAVHDPAALSALPTVETFGLLPTADRPLTQWELILLLRETPMGGLNGAFAFSSRRFGAATVERMWNQAQDVLRHAVADSRAPLTLWREATFSANQCGSGN